MRTARYKARYRRGEPDRYYNAFFIFGALVVVAAIFFIGLQVGRVVERGAMKEKTARKADAGTKEKIRKQMTSYTDEAVRIPVVTPAPPPPPPPNAGEELKKTEATATFPDSLTRKDNVPQPLVKPKAGAESASKKRFILQAAALKTREAAESLKGKLEREGYKARVILVPGKGKEKDLYKVRIGPHGSKEEALKAMRDIRTALKIDVILLAD